MSCGSRNLDATVNELPSVEKGVVVKIYGPTVSVNDLHPTGIASAIRARYVHSEFCETSDLPR